MSHFEDQLRDALGRKQVPEGFADKVVARVASPSRQFAPPKPSWWRMALPLAACLALLVVLGDWQYRRYQGEQAKQQVLQALRITGEKLSIAERQVKDLSRRMSHEPYRDR